MGARLVIPTEQVVGWYHSRRSARAPQINMAHQIRDAYNGSIALPLPELNRNEKAAVANLVKQGINQDATRTGSTLPTLLCPPIKETKKARDEADDRRRTLAGWWSANDFKKKQYRRLRHFIGYASSPVIIRPEFPPPYGPKNGRGIPVWQVLDPLSVFPPPSNDLDDMEPCDIIMAFTRSFSWLQYNHPDQIVGLDGADRAKPDQMFQLLEYADDDEHILVVLGSSPEPMNTSIWTPNELGVSSYKGAPYKELRRLKNLAGMCPAVVPGRVTLDKPQGKYDGMLPLFIKRARLAALEEIAIEKGVFENEWFVADTDQGDIVVEADGRSGVVGHVVGGKMEWHTQNVSQAVNIAIDRYERQERVEGSIPAEFGGESASNVRTDRRGNTILSVSQDPSMIETHDIMRESYTKEFARAIAVAKAYFGDAPKSFYVNWKGAKGPVTYVPNKLFADTDEVEVRWAMPGSDINGLTVAGGQRVQMGTLSHRGFMEIDPLVDDVEMEHDRIVAETFEGMLTPALQADLQSGLLTGLDVMNMMEMVVTNKKEPWDAYNTVHEQAQQRQAQKAAAQQMAPGTPAAQPGVTEPGDIGSTPQAQNLQGLSGLMQSLRGPGRVSATLGA